MYPVACFVLLLDTRCVAGCGILIDFSALYIGNHCRDVHGRRVEGRQGGAGSQGDGQRALPSRFAVLAQQPARKRVLHQNNQPGTLLGANIGIDC